MGRSRGSGTKHQKAAKRAMHPWINQQLMRAAELGDLRCLIATIDAYAPQMNLVNLATALHRLAKTAPAMPMVAWGPHVQPTLECLTAAVKAALGRPRATGPPQCQALANIAWSFARLEFVDMDLLEKLSQLGQMHLSDFKPFEVSTILWAFATLGNFDEAAWQCSQALFDVASKQIMAGPETLSFPCLVMIAWAFATARRRDAELFTRGIRPRLLAMAHTGNGRELAHSIWSFSKTGIRNEHFFSVLVKQVTPRLGELTAEELLCMLQGLRDAGCKLPKAFTKMVLNASGKLTFAVCQEVRAVLADPCFGTRRDGGRKSRARRASSEDSAEGRSSNEGSGERAQPELRTAGLADDNLPRDTRRNLPTDLPKIIYVKNTFIDVEDSSPANSRDGGITSLALQPSLDIIPPTISPEKLEAYRANYQRFRIGAAFGARGELSNSVVDVESLPECDSSNAAADEVGAETPDGREGRSKYQSDDGPYGPVKEGVRGECEEANKERDGQVSDEGAFWTGLPSWHTVSRLTVKNTFLHLNDDGDAGNDPGCFVPPKPLPPTLGIIPPGVVSPEHLEAYRADYQRFRAGSATGAHGELVSCAV